MAKGKITIEDVAREAGVSITTVSRYLNQDYGAMRAETRQRIQAVIEQLGYQPNKFAQGLKRNRSRTVAVVVVNMGYPFCVGVIRSLSDALHHAGYSLLVAETGGDKNREAHILQNLRAQSVDGLVIQTNGENQSLLTELAAAIPVVLIDRQFDMPGVVNIVTNNAEASEQLTRHLFAAGYTRVLYVTETLRQVSTRIDRLRGYEAACVAAHRTPWVVWMDKANPDSLRGVVDEILSARAQQPLAVYTANGLIMLELYPRLRSLPLSVPDELGIATFDQPDWAQVATPPLTCVRQPTEQIGQSAAETLLKLLRKKSDTRSLREKRVVLPSQLIPGGSTERNVVSGA
ncbi:HTH-type transcriptional regulator KdgR [Alicyclobacillus contaminans]|uniref:LacI family DNA-binding transcriptional regulator n=1 Tax=Alicyclobacillus contaminans TaxID=392016 RepID=UPI00042024C0|nr:LacI family DNA-binding transcriptional regulator [Alicyclobacillus contaminans]GMA51094.1 HTH-type transcriptional regulator KdgR [Alicyclobacillus contaminans]